MILDLAKHRFEEAREIYADEWLGFSEAELEAMLEKAGFTQAQTSVVDKEARRRSFRRCWRWGARAEGAATDGKHLPTYQSLLSTLAGVWHR